MLHFLISYMEMFYIFPYFNFLYLSLRQSIFRIIEILVSPTEVAFPSNASNVYGNLARFSILDFGTVYFHKILLCHFKIITFSYVIHAVCHSHCFCHAKAYKTATLIK